MGIMLSHISMVIYFAPCESGLCLRRACRNCLLVVRGVCRWKTAVNCIDEKPGATNWAAGVDYEGWLIDWETLESCKQQAVNTQTHTDTFATQTEEVDGGAGIRRINVRPHLSLPLRNLNSNSVGFIVAAIIRSLRNRALHQSVQSLREKRKKRSQVEFKGRLLQKRPRNTQIMVHFQFHCFLTHFYHTVCLTFNLKCVKMIVSLFQSSSSALTEIQT